MKEKGFIMIIVIAIISLILLKYFLNWDIFDAAETEQGKSTILYIRDLFNLIWGYIANPVVFIWERIIWPILDLSWDNFNNFIEWGKSNYTKTT